MKLPVAPNRDLGQHFLVDDNILGVAGRLAELGPEDVVLEVGAGLGVLTAYLAERVRLVHAVELDRSLEPYLRDALAGRENVELVLGDALTLPLEALDPPPGKLVANLPYQIATPLIAESLDGLPAVELWCVMVQREVADRFFAVPGTKSYGAVSVLVQLTAERTGFHPVARTVFRPPPNVDSALVAFRRTRNWGPEFAHLKEVVQSAFAHRRKTLLNSLGLSRGGRAEAESALEKLGLPRRPRRGARPPAVPRAGGAPAVKRLPAAAKINLALLVGPAREDGLHELVTVMQRIDICDAVEVAPAQSLAVDGFRKDTIVRAALERLAAAAGVEPHWRAKIRKRIPLAAGLGGGSADAAAALVLANPLLDEPLPAAERLASSPPASGPTFPSSSSPGPSSPRGPGERLTALELPQDFWVVVALPRRASKPLPPTSTPASTRRTASRVRGAARGADGGSHGRAPSARLRGLSAERSRRGGGQARDRRRPPGRRRLPGRRQRRRPRRLRALPPPRGREARRPWAARPGADLGGRSGLVASRRHGRDQDDRARREQLRPLAEGAAAPARAPDRLCREPARPLQRPRLALRDHRRDPRAGGYWFLGRRAPGVVYEITWVAAVSQLLAVLVPVLWVLVKTLALIVLIALAVFLLAALLLDRK